MTDLDEYFGRRREMTLLATRAFNAGENVVNTILSRFPDAKQEAIEIAYELQAGSYTANRDTTVSLAYRREQHDLLADRVFPRLNAHRNATLLDAGTGEGTGWYGFEFGPSPVGELHAVDISLRRLDYVQQNVALPRDHLSVVRADILNLPYWPKSFDLVVTMHAIEPNGGREHEAVNKLAGLTADLLCLFEPDYRAASPEGRARMEKLQYGLEIFQAAHALTDFDVLFEQPLSSVTNPLNPTTVICLKRKNSSKGTLRRRSPLSGLDLVRREDHFTEAGPGASAIFPIISGIQCMRRSDAVMRIERSSANPAQP